MTVEFNQMMRFFEWIDLNNFVQYNRKWYPYEDFMLDVTENQMTGLELYNLFLESNDK